MKKILTIAFITGIMFFTACKKEYTCECSYASGGTTSSTITDTKRNAKEACEDASQYEGIDCELK